MNHDDRLGERGQHTAGPQPAQAVALAPSLLPAFTNTTARIHRLAADERLRTLLSHSFQVVDWTVDDRNTIDRSRAALLRIRWGAHMASIIIDVSQHEGMASLTAADSDTHASVRLAIASILMTALITALDRIGINAVEVVSVDRDGISEYENKPCCAFSFRLDGQRIDAVLVDADEAWLIAFERLAEQQCAPLTQCVSEIRVPGRLQLGEKATSVAKLRSLRPGDVLLRAIPKSVAALAAGTLASINAHAVWGRYGTRQLHVPVSVSQAALTLNEDPIVSHDTHFNAPLTESIDEPVGVSELDLPLRLEIETVSLPVSQLSALRVGYVIDLPMSVGDARIRLVTYGQTIGFGELVTVGDHLGVRIIQVSHSHDSI
ncbi:type III secretion system cytoplasmic ring protein SctQ [Paraburkholderia sp. NMBU_R16]|uniref:type III secretion system cytoplasmic ring protein SctQ n=1 Tax=Paraburkholderia sp. NMBU_R16 TaxID=2698676 RepID=UPI0020B78DAD|nr:type III secretion system cytoplasmic ring protein SctQ [Paraburkholderia sp. NMBU_R16]